MLPTSAFPAKSSSLWVTHVRAWTHQFTHTGTGTHSDGGGTHCSDWKRATSAGMVPVSMFTPSARDLNRFNTQAHALPTYSMCCPCGQAKNTTRRSRDNRLETAVAHGDVTSHAVPTQHARVTLHPVVVVPPRWSSCGIVDLREGAHLDWRRLAAPRTQQRSDHAQLQHCPQRPARRLAACCRVDFNGMLMSKRPRAPSARFPKFHALANGEAIVTHARTLAHGWLILQHLSL